MTQMDLLEPRCRVPENKDSQPYRILMAMQAGQRLTVAVAIRELGCYALSQRIGELKRKYGWTNIQSRTVEVNSGARVSEYWLA